MKCERLAFYIEQGIHEALRLCEVHAHRISGKASYRIKKGSYQKQTLCANYEYTAVGRDNTKGFRDDGMKKFLSTLILIIVAFSGCTEKEQGTGEVKASMMSFDKIPETIPETYRFVTDSVQKITTFDNSTNASTMVVQSRDEGAVNLTARTMSVLTWKNASYGQEDLPAMRREIYLINDTAKIKLEGNWSQASLQDPEDYWNRQNIAEKQATILNRSQTELSGSELIGGENCYRIKVVPDMETYETVLLEHVGYVLPMDHVNLTDLYRSSAVNWTLWVSMDDYLLRKDHLKMRFSVTQEMTDLPEEQIADLPLEIDLDITTVYREYNQPVEITLPEGQWIVPVIRCANSR